MPLLCVHHPPILWQGQLRVAGGVGSQTQEGAFSGPKRRPAAGGWHKQKRWLVINAVTHA